MLETPPPRHVLTGILLLSVAPLILFFLGDSLALNNVLSGAEISAIDHSTIGKLKFGIAYILGALLFVPGAALTLIAGGLFGPFWGIIIVALATSAADAIAFLVARYLLRDFIKALATRYSKFGLIDTAVSKGGWRIIALLRLSPTIPYSASNYLYGLTGVGFLPYWITSAVFTLPGICAYIYLGYMGAETLSARARDATEWVLLAIGLVAILSATLYLALIARRLLRLDRTNPT